MFKVLVSSWKGTEDGKKQFLTQLEDLFVVYLPFLDTCKEQSPFWHVAEDLELVFLDHVIQKQEPKQWRLWLPVPQKLKDSINFQM